MDIEKLEGKIDRVAAGATEIHMGFGGVKFQNMMEIMEFAKLMAVSGCAVPFHLRGNPGACLAICTKALRFGFDPFSLAEHSYSMSKSTKTDRGWEDVETIAYDSFVIRAIIQAHANITGQLDYSYEGEGDERKCTVTAATGDGTKPKTLTSPTIGKLKEARGRNDKGKLKGSPLWETKPDQQLGYDTGRDYCRLYHPEILLGWYDKDELDDYAKASAAKDVTPASGLKERLKEGHKDGQGGFSHDHVTQQIGHSVGVTVDASVQPKETVPAGEAVEGGKKARKTRTPATDAPKPSDVADAKADETAEWLDERIAEANNLKSMTALDELDPMVWKRLDIDGRKKDLGPKWETEGFEPNRGRLTGTVA
jgi:hypothetical protein